MAPANKGELYKVGERPFLEKGATIIFNGETGTVKNSTVSGRGGKIQIEHLNVHFDHPDYPEELYRIESLPAGTEVEINS